MVKKDSDHPNQSTKMEMDSKPCFFKIFLEGFNIELLRVPPHFKKHLLKDLPHVSQPQRAVLRGPSGKMWSIKLIKAANDIFLKDGWQQFVSYHSLGNNEFVLFTYDGNLRFNVQIFDGHGTERVCSVSCPPKHQQPVAPDDQNDQVCGTLAAQHIQFRQPRELKRSMEEDYSEEKVKMEEVDLQFDERKGKKRVETGVIIPPSPYGSSKNNMDQKEEIAMNLKGKEAFNSKFPYFEKCLKKYCVQKPNYMRIPNPFARKYLFHERTKVILRNQKGKTWEVSYLPYGAAISFGGGWAAFAHDNKLKENDICIFELVGSREMNVYFHRS